MYTRDRSTESQPEPLKSAIRPTRLLVVVLLNYAFLVFLDISWSATFALFLSSPIDQGGLGFSPRAIGTVLSLASIFHGLFQAFFFAHIHKHWEPRNVYAVSIAAYVPIYLALPTMNALARRADRITPLIWILLALVKISCTFAYTAFSMFFLSHGHCEISDTSVLGCMYIFITLASPSPAGLGRTHAAAQTVFSLMGAIGPASVTSLIAASIQYNLLGGTLAYLVVAVIGLVAFGLAFLIPVDERRLNQSRDQ